jgi:hypothetical protein
VTLRKDLAAAEAVAVAKLRDLRAQGRTREQLVDDMHMGDDRIGKLLRKYNIPASPKMPKGTVRTWLRRR